MEATIQDVQQEIVDEFSAFDDWMDKYEYLIELGKSLPVSLLIRVYNGRTPEEILAADNSFIDRIGLKENLSPTRANGLVSMMEQIKEDAIRYSNGK